MKRITKLKVIYSNACVFEKLETELSEATNAPAVDYAKILSEWDPGIPVRDLDAIISRTKTAYEQMLKIDRRSITKNFRAPSGFSVKLTLIQYVTEPDTHYCGHGIEYIERLVNGRLRNQFQAGGLVLLRAKRDNGKVQGTIYEVPNKVAFDIEHIIPRSFDWSAQPGVLLTYTADGCYRVVYSSPVYDLVGDLDQYRPIATVVG